MSQNARRKQRKYLAAAVATAALAGFGQKSQAVLVTYDMYATAVNGTFFQNDATDVPYGVPGTGTVPAGTNDIRQADNALPNPIYGYKTLSNLTLGDVVTLDLYVTLANPTETGRSTTRKDDGYWTLNGSFQSAGTGAHLLGNIRGDTPNTSPTTTSNTPFFDIAAQSGFQHDIDGDGDLDVGSFAQDSVAQGTEFPWFVANAGTSNKFGPTNNTTVALVQWIGTTEFTVTGGAGLTSINFVVRKKTDGADESAKQFIHFVINNNLYNIDGFGNGTVQQRTAGVQTNTTYAKAGSMGTSSATVTGALAVGDPVVLEGTGPEPASLSLLGIGAAALLRRRARKT